MRTKLLFKSLLVAAGLCAGQSAWAASTVIYGRAVADDAENGYTAWSSTDVGTGQWGGNAAFSEAKGIELSGTSNRSTSKTFTITENSLLTIDFVLNTGTNTGNSSNYTQYSVGDDIQIKFNQQDQWGKVIINGVENAISNACGKTNGNRTGDTWTVHMEINTANDKLTALTLAGSGGTKKASYTLSDAITLSTNITTSLAVGININRSAGTLNTILNSIRIQEEEQAVTTADYTINYQLSGTTVKTVAGTSVVGAEITAETAIDGTEEGYVGNHYLATAAVAPSMVLVADAASNVLNVPVRAPYTATVNVTTTFDGVAQTPVATVFTETDAKVCDWSYFWTMYTEKDGKFYIASDVSKFGETGTFTDGQTINKTVAYTLAPTVAAYMEAESANTNSSNNTNYSGGKTGFVAGGKSYSLGTLPAGTYNLAVYLQDRGDRGIYLRSGSTTGTEIINLGTNNTSAAGVYNSNFTLTENTALYLTGYTSGTSTNQCANIDYILITAVSVSGTIASSGYSSLASAYGLDFSSATGIEGAYVVKSTTTEAVTLESVDELPANSGVILKGTPGATYSIPVKADAAFAGTNLLKAAVTATDIAANEAYILQSGLFHLVTAASTIPAGKAYLLATDVPSPARDLTFVFGDDVTTGIDEVRGQKETVRGECFNLAGQRVAQPTRGLYIVNGRKVVIK